MVLCFLFIWYIYIFTLPVSETVWSFMVRWLISAQQIGKYVEGNVRGWILANIHAFLLGTEGNCNSHSQDNRWPHRVYASLFRHI
jgi:hypothetical protein